jgi:hypothetical protein
MFSMQFITNSQLIKTSFWEAEIFLNVFSECRNAISEAQILKISREGHAPRHPS